MLLFGGYSYNRPDQIHFMASCVKWNHIRKAHWLTGRLLGHCICFSLSSGGIDLTLFKLKVRLTNVELAKAQTRKYMYIPL